MAELTLGTRTVQANVIKLREGTEGKALSDMTRDGVNNVAFKLDGDTYVASARGLNLDGVKEWGTVSYAGRSGHIVKADREELQKGAVKKWALVAAGVGLAALPLTGLGLGSLLGAVPSLAEFGIYAGVGTVIGGLVGAGWSAATNWFNGVQAKRDPLKKFEASSSN